MLTILVCTLAVGAAATTQDGPKDRHVRSGQPDVEALLDDGVARSATLAALVAALDASDVIVYVESNLHTPNRLRSRLDGYLAHRLTIARDRRYLWIVVNAGLRRDLLLSTIAHELQHAADVAHAPAVRPDDALRTFFQGIDKRT